MKNEARKDAEQTVTSQNEYLLVFFIAFITGILGQTIIPWLSMKLNLYWFDFRFLISNIDIYPLIVVLLIGFNNTIPKRAFWRIFIYFLGLCLGYYGYTSSIHIYNAIEYKNINYLSNVLSDINDVTGYLIIGTLAGVWCYIMLKYKVKKHLYFLLFLPFILLSAYILYSNLIHNPSNVFMIVVDISTLIGIILSSFNKSINNS